MKKIKQIVNNILQNKDLTRDELCEIARNLVQASGNGIKDLGYGISVRDFGDEKLPVTRMRIHKGYDSIEIDLRNGDTEAKAGENYITIHPERFNEKSGEITDVRVRFHIDDNYYFDESTGISRITVKKDGEPSDKEILSAIGKN